MRLRNIASQIDLVPISSQSPISSLNGLESTLASVLHPHCWSFTAGSLSAGFGTCESPGASHSLLRASFLFPHSKIAATWLGPAFRCMSLSDWLEQCACTRGWNISLSDWLEQCACTWGWLNPTGSNPARLGLSELLL